MNLIELSLPRALTHGTISDQEIRVGQMLLAQTVLALTKRIDALLAAAEREPEAEAPKPTKAPRAARAPKPVVTPAPAPAPLEPPAPVEVRSNGVPVDLALRYHEAYLEGREARRGGQAVDLNPFTGDRGIAGGRRLAWVRGWNEGGATS